MSNANGGSAEINVEATAQGQADLGAPAGKKAGLAGDPKRRRGREQVLLHGGSFAGWRKTDAGPVGRWGHGKRLLVGDPQLRRPAEALRGISTGPPPEP